MNEDKHDGAVVPTLSVVRSVPTKAQAKLTLSAKEKQIILALRKLRPSLADVYLFQMTEDYGKGYTLASGSARCDVKYMADMKAFFAGLDVPPPSRSKPHLSVVQPVL